MADDDAPALDILGTSVCFAHRDARQVSDRERRQLEDLVAAEQRAHLGWATVQALRIETDYLGRGARYTVTTLHHHTEETDDADVPGDS